MVLLLLVSVLFRRPLTLIILAGGIGGRGRIKMASAKNNQLISSQGRRMATIGVSDVVTASLYSEKIRMKKLMMKMIIIIIIIIIIIKNKSQETTVFHGRQKLTSAMK